MKRIIIIGGMGPQASLELHRRLIARASENGAVNGNDFPHIVHFSLPIDDFISDKTKTKAALEFIVRELKGLQFRQSDVIVVACNTAHLLQKDIEQALGIQITSLVDATIRHIAKNHKTVRIFASPTTIQSGLYTKKLKAAGVKVVLPTKAEINETEDIIRTVISGRDSPQKDLPENSLLGCTELSCAFGAARHIIDPLHVLVDKLLPRNEVL